MDRAVHSKTDGQTKVIFWVVIAAFCALICVLVAISIFLVIVQKPVDISYQEPQQSKNGNSTLRFRSNRVQKVFPRFTFDDLFAGKVFIKDSYDTQWLPNGNLLIKDDFFGLSNAANMIPMESTQQKLYLDDSGLMSSLSSNAKYAYRVKNHKQNFRHSVEAVYEIVLLQNASSIASYNVGPKANGNEFLQVFVWNSNVNSNDFIFVYENNIYYQADPEKPGSAIQITHDGEEKYKYGVTDWLYEEEILSSDSAIWWSSSGRYVAYMRFDDRSVNSVFMPRYLVGSQYPQYIEISYPKAGVANNPLVTLFVWDRQSKRHVVATPPEDLTAYNQSYYVFSCKWVTIPKHLPELGKERLLTVWSNREQNTVYVTICNELDCVLVYAQSFTMRGLQMWAEPTNFKNIAESARGFFIVLPHLYADGNVYNHVAHIALDSSGKGKVTAWHGRSHDVEEIVGYDDGNDTLSYAAASDVIGSMAVFTVTSAMSSHGHTANVSERIGDCDFSAASAPTSGRRLLVTCYSVFGNSRAFLVDTSTPNTATQIDNPMPPMFHFDLPTVQYESILLPSGYEVHVSMMLPPHLDTNEKHPLLLDLYGGPNSVKVKRRTPAANMIQLCSEYGVIIVQIDGRGSANRGWRIKAPVYKKLGMFEALDTVAAVRELKKKYSFIDENRVAAFGWISIAKGMRGMDTLCFIMWHSRWLASLLRCEAYGVQPALTSYGGFLSTQIAVRDGGEHVQCAIAIAPVADFALYDSAYTERYMGMPHENVGGYAESSLLTKVGNLKKVKYFLAHGESDDNVHYQNSALLAEALQSHFIHFKQLVYPNQDHGIGSKQAHMFMEAEQFLIEDCFGYKSNFNK